MHFPFILIQMRKRDAKGIARNGLRHALGPFDEYQVVRVFRKLFPAKAEKLIS